MPNFRSRSLFFALNAIFFLAACESRLVDQLRPETQEFLANQEEARCTCLEMYGEEMLHKINQGIEHIESFSEQYDLEQLTPEQAHTIKLRLIPTTSMIKTVSACIQKRTPPIDELTGLLIQEDLRVVLQLDSTLSEQEQLQRMNQPSLELLDERCPQHKDAVLRMQDLIEAAQVLPPGLQ